MNKKGAELAVNTIIVAAICLVVAFIVLGIFTGFTQKFVNQLFNIGEQSDPSEFARNCEYQGGYCTSLANCKGGIIPEPSGGWKEGCEICCKNI